MLYPSFIGRLDTYADDHHPKTVELAERFISPSEKEHKRVQFSSMSANQMIHELSHLVQMYVSKPEDVFVKRCKQFNLGFSTIRPDITTAYGLTSGQAEIETMVIELKLSREIGETAFIAQYDTYSYVGAVIAFGPTGSRRQHELDAFTENCKKKYEDVSILDLLNDIHSVLAKQEDFSAPFIEEEVVV